MLKRVLSIALILWMPSVVKADTFTIASYPWAPFVDRQREDGGIAMRIVREALARKGHNIKTVNVPWVRALSMLNKNQIDILPAVWYAEDRAKTMRFSNHYTENRIVFIKTKNDNYEFEGLPSLHNKVIGIVRDYAYKEAFLNDTNIKFSMTNSLENNVKKVISGRVDLTLDDEIVAKSIIPPNLLAKVTFTKNALSENKLYITCNKINSKCDMIIDDFNTGLKLIRDDGTLNHIINNPN